jgi:hypothetical protein
MGGGRVAFDSSEQTTLRNIRTKRNTPMLMSADVLACLFHLPSNDDVNDDTVSWESGTEFGFLPPEAEAVDMEDDDDWDTDW